MTEKYHLSNLKNFISVTSFPFLLLKQLNAAKVLLEIGKFVFMAQNYINALNFREQLGLEPVLIPYSGDRAFRKH